MQLDALVFDAYGTLFDVHSVIERCEGFWPGQGAVVSNLWRTKQLEYTWLRSLMGRYRDFEVVTEHALRHACETLALPCDDQQIKRLMEEYRNLRTFPEVQAVMSALGNRRRAILSNGSPDMLNAVVQNSGLDKDLDGVLSVDPLKMYKPAPRVRSADTNRAAD